MPSLYQLKILLLLLLSIVNLGYIAYHAKWLLSPPSATEQHAHSYRGHDYPKELPLSTEIETVLVTMEETVHYLPLGMVSDRVWLSASSTGYGYVRLGPEDRTFIVSMFHELHCLRMTNRAFTKSSGATVEHLRHCLNYLRLAILCSPDLALESGNFEEKDFEVERLGGTHTCKNWDPIYRFMDDNYDAWINRTGFDDPVYRDH